MPGLGSSVRAGCWRRLSRRVSVPRSGLARNQALAALAPAEAEIFSFFLGQPRRIASAGLPSAAIGENILPVRGAPGVRARAWSRGCA
jgi:hypothetical protein